MESARKKRILAIEDDPTYIRLLKTYLKAKGYEVFIVTDGLKALNEVRHIMPDLVITDYLLPGLDGHKFCRMVKFDNKLRHIPVIMLTARDLGEVEQKAKQMGADLFLSKTQPIQELLKVLPAMLKKSEQQKENS